MLSPGSRLGESYEILGVLGAGGMGEVYRGRDLRLGREVAIKVLPADVADDPVRMGRFEQEARAASALNHPNIVTLHDMGRHGTWAFQVLELVAGRTLRDVVADGPLPLRRVLSIAEQIAAGLAAAHGAGIVHRDLKPENVMVRDDGVVKILDFGLAKLERARIDSGSHIATATGGTAPGVVLGTVGYMAPEQARGGVVDFRADQFALGAVLYEMVSGVRAFRGESAVQTLSAIIEREPEPVARLREGVPRPLVWIVERCLAKDPSERYASTIDLRRDLARVREELSEVSFSGQAAAVPASASKTTPGPIVVGALLALCGLAAGLVGGRLLLAPSRAQREPPTLRTLTFSGEDREPSSSPDGRTLVFTSIRDGRSRIWLKSLTDGTEAPLTTGHDAQPRFSPDGSSVLFTREEAGRASLFRVPVLGGEPRRLVSDASFGDWSPDGGRIVFLRVATRGSDAVTMIVVARSDGGDERVLTTIDRSWMASPRWSPDGRSIAISASQYGTSEAKGKFVQIVPVDGSESKRLDPPIEGGVISGIAWLGRGAEIVYSQGESVSSVVLSATLVNGGASRLIRQNVQTGAAETILWTPSLSSQVEVVGPGCLVFDSMSGRQNLEEHDLGVQPATVGRVLAAGTSIDRQPVYTPDGEWIAFSSNRSGNLDIWARSLRTGELRRLTDHPEDDWDPGFTPDGKHLIWTSRRGGNFEIWIAEADGSAARQLTHDGTAAENATATPDGQWLVYNSGSEAQGGLWKIRSDGTEATRLVPGTCVWPEVSPDGRYFSYAQVAGAGRSEIHVARIADGGIEPFTIVLQGVANGGRTRWMRDGSIAFNYAPAGRSGVFAVRFEPGQPAPATWRTLVELPAGALAESFGVSPDGTRLVLATSYRSYALMTSEGLPGIEPRRRG
jgi:eukaryotic-like serine/threonine-protein kinase